MRAKLYLLKLRMKFSDEIWNILCKGITKCCSHNIINRIIYDKFSDIFIFLFKHPLPYKL